MIGVSVRGLTQAKAKLNKLGGKQFRTIVMRDLLKVGYETERAVKQKYSGQPIRVRSGQTRQSIRTQPFPEKLRVVVGSPKPHVGVLEDGATIRPVRAKVLTIPLEGMRTAAGKSRGSARQAGMRFETTFWKRSRRGTLILFGKTGDHLTPIARGVTRVTIKGRHPFAQVAKTVGGKLVRTLEKSVGEAVK